MGILSKIENKFSKTIKIKNHLALASLLLIDLDIDDMIDSSCENEECITNIEKNKQEIAISMMSIHYYFIYLLSNKYENLQVRKIVADLKKALAVKYSIKVNGKKKKKFITETLKSIDEKSNIYTDQKDINTAIDLLINSILSKLTTNDPKFLFACKARLLNMFENYSVQIEKLYQNILV